VIRHECGVSLTPERGALLPTGTDAIAERHRNRRPEA